MGVDEREAAHVVEAQQAVGEREDGGLVDLDLTKLLGLDAHGGILPIGTRGAGHPGADGAYSVGFARCRPLRFVPLVVATSSKNSAWEVTPIFRNAVLRWFRTVLGLR